MHPTYVALHEVTSHGVWLTVYTKLAPRRQQVSRGTNHVTTKQRCKYTTSVGIQKALKTEEEEEEEEEEEKKKKRKRKKKRQSLI